jgi:hypothetical protein
MSSTTGLVYMVRQKEIGERVPLVFRERDSQGREAIFTALGSGLTWLALL